MTDIEEINISLKQISKNFQKLIDTMVPDENREVIAEAAKINADNQLKEAQLHQKDIDRQLFEIENN